MAATIIDFELASCRSESQVMAKLATSDTLEIHLRKLGAFIYYRRTKDKTGANRMLGVRAPGTNADIAPKWMLDDANTHSKTEYQRIERGQKLSRLEHGGGSGGVARAMEKVAKVAVVVDVASLPRKGRRPKDEKLPPLSHQQAHR